MAVTSTTLNNGTRSIDIDVVANTVGALQFYGSPWAGAFIKVQQNTAIAPTLFRDAPFSAVFPLPSGKDGGGPILHLGPKMRVLLDMPNPVPTTGPSITVEYTPALVAGI